MTDACDSASLEPAPKRHHPKVLRRVRWTRPTWERRRNGRPRWSVRNYTTEATARRCITGLTESGATVTEDVYLLTRMDESDPLIGTLAAVAERLHRLDRPSRLQLALVLTDVLDRLDEQT